MLSFQSFVASRSEPVLERVVETSDEDTIIAMVVDRSGSMSSTAADTVEGLNAYLGENKGERTKFFVLTFDDKFSFPSNGHEYSSVTPHLLETIPLVDSKDVKNFSLVKSPDTWHYEPRGMTALNDAIGYTILRLDRLKGRKFVVVQTDGLENSSREFTNAQIKKMVKDRDSWDFYFMGASLDAVRNATTKHGFSVGKCLQYGQARKSKTVWEVCSAATQMARCGGSGDYTKEQRMAAE